MQAELNAHLAEKATDEDLGHVMVPAENIDENGLLIFPEITTTADATYYVDTAGDDDENDGLSAGTPFKTINKALSLIPPIVNHVIRINISNGTYAEAIRIEGKVGKGSILLDTGTNVILTGTTNQATSSSGLAAIVINQCHLVIGMVTNPIIIKPSGDLGSEHFTGVDINGSLLRGYLSVNMNGNDVTTSGNKIVFKASSSTAYISVSVSTNNTFFIHTEFHAKIHTRNNTGSGNGTVLRADRGSTISKEGTLPSGTTAEVINTGGVIR